MYGNIKYVSAKHSDKLKFYFVKYKHNMCNYIITHINNKNCLWNIVHKQKGMDKYTQFYNKLKLCFATRWNQVCVLQDKIKFTDVLFSTSVNVT